MQEREMTKKDKAKEKRLKKKYDDSDMKASMKKQYGDDWKNVYYATIRKKAMEDIKEAEENSYTVVHAKHGKEVIKATSSYGAAKKYADMKKLKSTAGVDAHLMEAIKEGMDPASPELAKIFDNLKRGDKVKIKHDSALEKGTDYIEYVVRSNNVLRNGVEKATLARADSPTSVKRILYKRNGKVSMAIGDMAATLVDIQVDEGYYKMPDIDRERYTEMPGLEGPFQTRSGKVVYYDPKEGAYYDRDTDMYMTYDEFKDLDNVDPVRSKAESIVSDLKKQLEGHSPHKKGTKKYKAHMAAMHANSAEPEGQMIETKEEKPKTVTLEDMRSVLELDKDTTPLDIVSNYVKTTLDETFDTWPKVRQQVDYILSRVDDTNSVSSDEVFDKVFKENLQSQLDEQVMVSENIDTLRDIVNNKSAMTVKFQDGTMKVDMTTASIFLQAYDKMKESNQEKISEMMKTKKGFLRVLDFIYGAIK